MMLPTDAQERKNIPVYSGFIEYFPLAIIEVAKLSKAGNDQHNPGKPLHWDRSKSGDELDAMLRHILEGDWTAVAWRAMANLQKELEAEQEAFDRRSDEPTVITPFDDTMDKLKEAVAFLEAREPLPLPTDEEEGLAT